jgi:hypothetical protein
VHGSSDKASGACFDRHQVGGPPARGKVLDFLNQWHVSTFLPYLGSWDALFRGTSQFHQNDNIPVVRI